MAYRLRPFVKIESAVVLLVIFLFFFGNKVYLWKLGEIYAIRFENEL